MKTKLFMVLTIIMMGVCTSLQAQNQQKKERTFPGERMIKELNLSDKQVADLKKADSDITVQMKAIRDQRENSRKEMKESLEKIKDSRREMFKKSLTTEQYIKFLELEVDRLQKMVGKRAHMQQRMQMQHRFNARQLKEVKESAPKQEKAAGTENQNKVEKKGTVKK
ncbi:hypothetical protein [Bacteroides sedimenti]